MRQHGFFWRQKSSFCLADDLFLRSCYLRDGLISAAQSSSPRSKFAIVTKKKRTQLLKSWRETFNIKKARSSSRRDKQIKKYAVLQQRKMSNLIKLNPCVNSIGRSILGILIRICVLCDKAFVWEYRKMFTTYLPAKMLQNDAFFPQEACLHPFRFSNSYFIVV